MYNNVTHRTNQWWWCLLIVTFDRFGNLPVGVDGEWALDLGVLLVDDCDVVAKGGPAVAQVTHPNRLLDQLHRLILGQVVVATNSFQVRPLKKNQITT